MSHNLENIVTGPTCFKNPLHLSSIDLMLTNQIWWFQESIDIESGLSDHHMMTIGVMKSFFPKQTPSLIRYQCYRKFNSNNFGNKLLNNLETLNENARYDFETNLWRRLINTLPWRKHLCKQITSLLSPKNYLRLLWIDQYSGTNNENKAE